jgi:hypothetical protein
VKRGSRGERRRVRGSEKGTGEEDEDRGEAG